MLASLPCACATLRRATRAVAHLYDEELRATGLTGPQFTLLQALDDVGVVRQGDLGEALALDRTTLTRTLRPLEEAGWIRIRPGADRRERHVELTPGGARQLRAASPAWERAQRRLRRALGESAWQALFTHLDDISAAALDA